MFQFIIYAVCGFCDVWLITFFWGFTKGPANAAPYFGLIGGLLLFVLAAPISMFLPRIAACLGLLGSVFILVLPLFYSSSGSDLSGWLLWADPPTLAVAIAGFSLWKTRSQSWFLLRSAPHLAVRVPIALLPLIIFVVCFNARLVIQLVFDGPPR